MKRTILLAGIAAVLSLAASAQEPAATSKGNADNGKRLFARDGCYECHGYVGQGGAQGVRIAPKPVPFAVFERYVRNPSGVMPPFSTKVVSPQELADIYAYLSSIPQPPPAKSIPLLN
jgi:mono/diheme cytochrome c family protein